MWIMDFANDDNFTTSWNSNKTVSKPWYEIDFRKERPFNMISIVEPAGNIKKYRLEYQDKGVWKSIPAEASDSRVKIHRFNAVRGGKVRILIDEFSTPPAISEFGVYNEKR